MTRDEALAALAEAKKLFAARSAKYKDDLRIAADAFEAAKNLSRELLARATEEMDAARYAYYDWCQSRAKETEIPLAVRQAFFDATRWLPGSKHCPAVFLSAEALGLPYRSGHDWNRWTRGLQESDPNPYKGRAEQEILSMLRNIAKTA